MPDASISLGLNANEMYGELKTAEGRFNAGLDRMGASTNRLAGSHENLLRSSHRVAGQIHNVTRDLLSGASAGDVFGASLEGIGRSLNLSLGALTGLAIGAVGIAKIAAIREEYHALAEELKKVHEEASKSGDFQTLSQLEAATDRAAIAVKKLQDRIDARGGKQGFWASVGQAFKDVAYDVFTASAVENEDVGAQKQGYADLDKFSDKASDKLHRQNASTRARMSGTPDYLIKAQELQAAFNEANNPVHLLTEATIKLKLAFEDLAKSVNDKHLERAGMTISEMVSAGNTSLQASLGYNDDWTANPNKYAGIQKARQAMAADAQGEAARLNFDPEGAHEKFNLAGGIKNGINGLKPSEQMESAFKGALIVTEEYLKTIAKNTGNPLVGAP